MQISNKKQITFPASKDGKSPAQKIPITNHMLGKGAFGQVHFCYDVDDP